MKKSPIEAAAAGEEYYFTGVPCKNGHLSKRYTINSDCMECAKERNKQNMRQYRSKLKTLMAKTTKS